MWILAKPLAAAGMYEALSPPLVRAISFTHCDSSLRFYLPSTPLSRFSDSVRAQQKEDLHSGFNCINVTASLVFCKDEVASTGFENIRKVQVWSGYSQLGSEKRSAKMQTRTSIRYSGTTRLTKFTRSESVFTIQKAQARTYELEDLFFACNWRAIDTHVQAIGGSQQRKLFLSADKRTDSFGCKITVNVFSWHPSIVPAESNIVRPPKAAST
ncbi:hypothetical protein R3P38DRAFT_2763865 [Favolaschia claudopus]|uniref:Uncharacterized protein n=1 Tax=Favolaschia claudopus TaxID=2862362 RepID=A0AAW0DGH1_9AGAR